MITDNRLDRALRQLRMPEGMEQRLSARIDALASARRRRIYGIIRWGVAAAAVAVVAFAMRPQPQQATAAQELTPEQVRFYTEMALGKASAALHKGADGIETTDRTLNYVTQKLQQI